MQGEFIFSLDLILALFVMAYIAKLLLRGSDSERFYSVNSRMIKRSLLNQQVALKH